MSDFPSNPAAWPGHVLEFGDEFDGDALDLDKWLPCHLPHWSSRHLARARAGVADGCLTLRIDDDQAPWCPEFDGAVRVSSLQTGAFAGPVGSPVGQHRFNPAAVVREAQPTRASYVPLHGCFELRARGPAAPDCHAALWMIGYEDEPERSGEICICELFGKEAGRGSSVVRFGVHPFGDARIVDDFRRVELPLDTREFHLYAAEWTPHRVSFFVDNREIGVVEQSPGYPMQFMLGLYQRPQADVAEPAAGARQFVVDYFRAYRSAGSSPAHFLR